MRALRPLLRLLAGDRDGSMVIETAIVAPVLVVLTIGAYDASRIFSRQTELQGAIGEATSVALAAAAGAATDTTKVKDILVANTGLPAANVTVSKVYRCGSSTDLLASSATCASTDQVSTYMKIRLVAEYDPMWSAIGIGSEIDYDVQRTVQIG